MVSRKRTNRRIATTPTTISESHKKNLIIVALVAVVVRFLYNIELTDSLLFNKYFLDSQVLHAWALDILGGNTPDLPFFRAPLYPYFLALSYKIFGVSPWSIIIVQNLLGLLTAIFTYKFANCLFGRKIAFWSGVVTAVYPTLVFFEGETMITTVAVFLYTLAIYLMYLSIQNPSTANVVKAGVIFGLAAIARPTILPLAIIFPIALTIKFSKPDFKSTSISTLVFAVAILIPILPVTISNFVNGSEFVIISTQGGANFYVGNSQKADGITAMALGPQLRMGKYQDNIWTSSVDEANRRAGRQLSQSQVSSFWVRETLSEIKNDFGRWMGLYLKKFYLFWHGQEIFNNKSPYYAGEYSQFMNVAIWKKFINFPSGILFPLMFMGIFLTIHYKQNFLVPASYLVLFSLLISLFFVCARFRQPIIPIAITFAVYSVHYLASIRKENIKRFLFCIVVIIFLIVGLNWGGNIESKQNLSQFYMVLGWERLEQREYNQAITEFEKSLELLPKNMTVFDQLGEAYFSVGQIDKAKEVYEKGHLLYPSYPLYNFGLGRVYQQQMESELAKKYYLLTLEYAPDFAPAYDRLGLIYKQQGQIDSAIYNYEKLIAIQGRNLPLEKEIERLKNELEEINNK